MPIVSEAMLYPQHGQTSYCTSCMEDCEDGFVQVAGGLAYTIGSWVFDIVICSDDPPMLINGS